MSTIYKVIHNVRNGAETIEAGSFIDEKVFDESTVAELINGGIIAEIEGASDIAEAEAIIAEKAALAAEEAEVVAAATPKNTWGPQADEEAGLNAIESNDQANADATAPVAPEATETTGTENAPTEPTTAPEETGENL